ncbi:NTP transferase domain-containing protein [bacterium]|nr:NTP transferase domain-containing protein [bacterium]
MSFPNQIPAILLMGGQIKDLPKAEPEVPSKGYIPVGDMPMSARTLQALLQSKRVGAITLVTPVSDQQLTGSWAGAFATAHAGATLSESLFRGLDSLGTSPDPALIVAGDLPFLTAEAIDDFIDRCSKRDDCSLWYGYLSKSNSIAKYPTLHHTWGSINGGKYCGTGLSAMRTSVTNTVREAVSALTSRRKSVWKLAKALGFGTLWHLLRGNLTVTQAEEAMTRFLGEKICGIESPFAETAFNVDEYDSLLLARKLAEAEDSKA